LHTCLTLNLCHSHTKAPRCHGPEGIYYAPTQSSHQREIRSRVIVWSLKKLPSPKQETGYPKSLSHSLEHICNYLNHRKKQPWRRHKTVARPKGKGLVYVRGEGGKLQKWKCAAALWAAKWKLCSKQITRNLEAWGSMADFYSFQLPHTTQITVRTTEIPAICPPLHQQKPGECKLERQSTWTFSPAEQLPAFLPSCLAILLSGFHAPAQPAFK
jgi:hypothetical protein